MNGQGFFHLIDFLFQAHDLLLNRGDGALGINDRQFLLQSYQAIERFIAGNLGILKTFYSAFHLVIAQALGDIADALFGIMNKRIGKLDAGIGRGGNHLHIHQTFGWVIADFYRFLENFEGLLFGGIRIEPGQRINGRVAIMGNKIVILIQADHRFD